MSTIPSPGQVRRGGRAAALLFVLACLVPASAAALPDGRGWEMVSPIDKNGGEVAAAKGVANGGVLQAAADGGSVTYSSAFSFAGGAGGAPPASQYLSARGAGGWSTANLTVPVFSGSYGASPNGVPYQLFSPELSRGLLVSGRHCRSQEAGCPVANPALTGTDAPDGYVNYYLRQAGGFEALLGAGDVAGTDLDPVDFDLRFAGASPDLAHVMLESCAALTPGAVEVPLGEGCDPGKQNLYKWSGGSLGLVNSTPGATLAAQASAISADGGRVYFNDSKGDLYLREGGQEKLVAEAAGVEPVAFQAASADGSIAYYLLAGGLFQYLAPSETTTPVTAAFETVGVLGAAADGSRVYYVANDGLYSWSGGVETKAPTSGLVPTDASNFPPTTGTARVSADGGKLLFLSSKSLTGYNNTDQVTALPDSEAFLFDAKANTLRCVSCRPDGTRPIGPSTVSGANPNGVGKGAAYAYKPRVLSIDASRVFFDSGDALVAGDTNKAPDVYQWEAFGPGCAKATGCIELISSGRSPEGASFADASLTGDDAFFLTDGSLVKGDPGSVDLYDARVGGGFPNPPVPIPCTGDSCQSLPSEPVDPALGTFVPGPGNPKEHYFKYRRRPEKTRCKGTGKHRKCQQKGKSKAKNGKKGGKR